MDGISTDIDFEAEALGLEDAEREAEEGYRQAVATLAAGKDGERLFEMLDRLSLHGVGHDWCKYGSDDQAWAFAAGFREPFLHLCEQLGSLSWHDDPAFLPDRLQEEMSEEEKVFVGRLMDGSVARPVLRAFRSTWLDRSPQTDIELPRFYGGKAFVMVILKWVKESREVEK